jgi:hypothetical protein
MLPTPPGGVTRKFVQLQIFGCDHFRKHQNLARVHSEVFNNMIQGLHHGNIHSLNHPWFRERRRIEPLKDACSRLHRRSEVGNQFLPRDYSPLVKFPLTIACDRLFSHSSDNPLRYVPGQVQHQISDAVGRFVGAPPDLLVCESVNCRPNAREKILSKKGRRKGDERSSIIHEYTSLFESNNV